ncbi:MAG: hypothetical protein ACI4MG_06200, partial [Aristaeellaceae bacterium]
RNRQYGIIGENGGKVNSYGEKVCLVRYERGSGRSILRQNKIGIDQIHALSIVLLCLFGFVDGVRCGKQHARCRQDGEKVSRTDEKATPFYAHLR